MSETSCEDVVHNRSSKSPQPVEDQCSWKRSESDASFFLSQSLAKNRGVNTSECATVYSDLSCAVEQSENESFSRQNNSRSKKTSGLTKSGSSKSYVHWEDSHEKKAVIDPSDDDFCRRQSSPAAPYDIQSMIAGDGMDEMPPRANAQIQVSRSSQRHSCVSAKSEKTHLICHEENAELTKGVRSSSLVSESATNTNLKHDELVSTHRIWSADALSTSTTAYQSYTNKQPNPDKIEQFRVILMGKFDKMCALLENEEMPHDLEADEIGNEKEDSHKMLASLLDCWITAEEKSSECDVEQSSLPSREDTIEVTTRLVDLFTTKIDDGSNSMANLYEDQEEEEGLMDTELQSEPPSTPISCTTGEDRSMKILFTRLITQIWDHIQSTDSHTPDDESVEELVIPTRATPQFGVSTLARKVRGFLVRQDSRDVELSRECLSLMGRLFELPASQIDPIEGLSLHTLALGCRSEDLLTLRSVVQCIFNIALSNSFKPINRGRELVSWFLRFAVHSDPFIKYLTCLTAAVLSINHCPQVVSSVIDYGILDFVRPFVNNHHPNSSTQWLLASFFCRHQSAFSSDQPPVLSTSKAVCTVPCRKCYAQSSFQWLNGLLPVLSRGCVEARICALFHFAAEAELRSNYKCEKFLKSDRVIQELTRNAYSIDPMEYMLSTLALSRLSVSSIPRPLTARVPHWTTEDVICWLERTGFYELCYTFQQSRIDGDLLLQLDDDWLNNDLGITDRTLRARFIRCLAPLRIDADYSSVDRTDLAGWLLQCSILPLSQRYPSLTLHGVDEMNPNQNLPLSPSLVQISTVGRVGSHSISSTIYRDPRTNLVQYTYLLLKAGVERHSCALLNDGILKDDCRIGNSIHRARILAASGYANVGSHELDPFFPPIHAFISYRRQTGALLASLVYVSLKKRGYALFMDVHALRGGTFREQLHHAIKKARCFILILTANALDRCCNDEDGKDWIHQETVWALQNGCQVIPILADGFHWPSSDELPKDMNSIAGYNAIKYTPACFQSGGIRPVCGLRQLTGHVLMMGACSMTPPP